MAVVFTNPDLTALLHITRNLRARDAEECLVTQFNTPDELAIGTLRAGPFQWIAWSNGFPVASIGAVPMWTNVWAAWAYGTDYWNDVVLSLTKHVRRIMIPSLYDSGVRRVEVKTLEKHTQAHRWLEKLGAEREGMHPEFGRNGETFFTYAWRRDDV